MPTFVIPIAEKNASEILRWAGIHDSVRVNSLQFNPCNAVARVEHTSLEHPSDVRDMAGKQLSPPAAFAKGLRSAGNVDATFAAIFLSEV